VTAGCAILAGDNTLVRQAATDASSHARRVATRANYSPWCHSDQSNQSVEKTQPARAYENG